MMRTTLHLSAYGASKIEVEESIFEQIGKYLGEPDIEKVKERVSIDLSVDREYETVTTGGGVVAIVSDHFSGNATVKVNK